MKLKALLVSAAIAAAVVPAGFAHADGVCETNIIFFSGYVVSHPTTGAQAAHYGPADFGSLDCLLLQSGQDTHLIYPGSNGYSVRWGGTAEPTSGTAKFAGVTKELTFTKTAVTGGGEVWDTPWYLYDQAASLTGGVMAIDICVEDECEHQEYHTIG
jgi:hypothetical protein